MEAHGGYLCRFEDVDAAWLQGLARRALEDDGMSADDVSLIVCVLPGAKVVRFAWDGGAFYGRRGAQWYARHHAFARRLSEHLQLAVHAYSFDPDEQEQVVSYGNGRKVGGEALNYEDAELPDGDEDDELSFQRMKNKWPLGHLARVLGIAREELIRIPRQDTALIDLGKELQSQPLWLLFPRVLASLKRNEAFASAR